MQRCALLALPHFVSATFVVHDLTASGLELCVRRDSFTPLVLADAVLVRSNLGGQGGRCTDPTRCAEPQTPTTSREIYIRNVARAATGEQISLRITNETECTLTRTSDRQTPSLLLPTQACARSQTARGARRSTGSST